MEVSTGPNKGVQASLAVNGQYMVNRVNIHHFEIVAQCFTACVRSFGTVFRKMMLLLLFWPLKDVFAHTRRDAHPFYTGGMQDPGRSFGVGCRMHGSMQSAVRVGCNMHASYGHYTGPQRAGRSVPACICSVCSCPSALRPTFHGR